MTSYLVQSEEREVRALLDRLQDELGRLQGGIWTDIAIKSEHFTANITIKRKR